MATIVTPPTPTTAESWGLFGDDSSEDSSSNENEDDTNNHLATDDLTGTAVAVAVPPPPPPPPPPPLALRNWKDLIPMGVHQKTGLVTNTDVPWEISAVPALPPHQAPLMNAIQYQSSGLIYYDGSNNIGGGRGYILTKDVPPGTLLLRETCAVVLPSLNDTVALGYAHPTVALLHRTLIQKNQTEHGNKQMKNINDLKMLYPVTNNELNATYLSRKEDEFGKDLKRLVDVLMVQRNHAEAEKEQLEQQSEKTSSSTSSSIKKKQKQKQKKKLKEQCLNMLCSIHCNAFVNGLHFHLAMLNHSCSPNCVKLGTTDLDGNKMSEVWTTQHIKQGEEATISYLLPRMQSFKSRREKLFRQFDFTCGCALCTIEEKEENEKEEQKEQKEQEEQKEQKEKAGQEQEKGHATERDKELRLFEKEHVLEYQLLPLMESNSPSPLLTTKENIIQKLAKGLAVMKQITEMNKGTKKKKEGNSFYSSLLIMGRAHQTVAMLCARLLALPEDAILTEQDVQSIFDSSNAPASFSPNSFIVITPRTTVIVLFLESLLSHMTVRQTLTTTGLYPHAELVDVFSDISTSIEMLLTSTPNHTLLMNNGIKKSKILSTYNLTSIHTLIQMEQTMKKVAQSIGKLYADRWRMGSGNTNNSSNNVCHVVCGPPAAGKTTVAKRLFTLLNAKMLLDSDVISTRLIEAGLKLNGMDPNDRDSVRYKKTYRDPVYETMYDIVQDNFKLQPQAVQQQQQHVVLCGPFTSECRDPEWLSKMKNRFNHTCRVEVHYVSCKDDIRRVRMIARNEKRDATKLTNDETWSVHCSQASKERPLFPHHYKENSKEE